MQAKLAIGGHDDPLEREADRAAAMVTGRFGPGLGAAHGSALAARGAMPLAPAPAARAAVAVAPRPALAVRPAPAPAAGGVAATATAAAPEQADKEEPDDAERRTTVRRPSAAAAGAPSEGGAGGPPLEQALLRRRGGGQPLPPETRARMEAGFGFDFARVRVHTGDEADHLNAAIGARAFTHGADVYFRAGAYDPQSGPGAWLLAHELTHVVQQGAAAAGGTGLLQRKCACGAGAGASGSCAQCDEEEPSGGAPLRVQRAPEDSPAAEPPTGDSARASAATGPDPAAVQLLVEDDAPSVAPEQMRKSEFLEATRTAACASADEAMARVGRSTEGCPYVERMLGYYAGRSAAQVERSLRRFAPEAAAARTARDYVPHVSARVARGVERWATTGELPDVPDELRAQMAGGGIAGAVASVLAGVGRALSSLAGALFKRHDGGGARAGAGASAPAPTGAEPSAALGPGRPLDGAAQARMERAFGHGFGAVRIHTDRGAADLTRALDARAFTVGDRIVFGAGEYHPGDPAGDALLAHELAHVVQQEGTTADPATPADLTAPTRGDLEDDADRAAAGATMALWSERPDGAPVEPAARRLGRAPGLRLQRCHHARPPVTAAAPPVPSTQGCSTDDGGKVLRALGEARTMVRTTRTALGGGAGTGPLPRLGGQLGTPSAVAAAALLRTFKTNDRRVAAHVEGRLGQIETILDQLLSGGGGSSLRIECHTVANDPTCNDAVAYLPAIASGATQREGMFFCQRFFTDQRLNTDQGRGGVVVHEVAHALVGGEHIDDRAYSHFRYYPDLTTEEALTNADSYRIFVLHVSSGTAPEVGHIFSDILEDCDETQEGLINLALRRTQQWLMVAQRVTTDRRPDWLALTYWQDQRTRFLGGLEVARIDTADAAYRFVLGRLGMFISGKCHSTADAVCPAGTVTASTPGTLGDDVHVCPDWLGEQDADRRALLLLAEMTAGAGVASAQDRMNLAKMAQELFTSLGEAPDLRTILGLPPSPGDFPIRTLPPGVEAA
ncbi:MAG TPA: DUF4157 domain-containing protein [Myxococcota bacterium]|nr:DUF4157 domain-containing protein [Myxococcota bacterium]